MGKNKRECFESEINRWGKKLIITVSEGYRTKQAIQVLEETKKNKLSLRSNSVLIKFIKSLSAQTDLMGQLLKQKNNWNKTAEHSKCFTHLKTNIMEAPCLAHSSSNLPYAITADANTRGLGVTLWPEQLNGDLKPIALEGRFLSDTEKKAINDLELLASMGIKTVSFIHLL